MKTIFLILLLCGSANAEVVREISGVITKDNVNSRVGINLASGADPTVTLDVNGALKASGATTMSGAFTATSSLTVTGAGGVDVTYGVKAATGVFTNTGASSLDIGGGLNAGTGNVALVDATGKITALSSTYLANLSGTNLTGVVLKAGDSMSGQLTLNASSLTITGTENTTFIKLIKDVDEYVAIGMRTNSGDGTGLLIQTRDWNSPQYDTIDALDITAAGYITMKSSVTFSASNFSVGGSTVAVTAGKVGIGTTAPADKVDIASGTIRMAGSGAPTTGGALCLNAAGQMAKCTSAIDASGNCTCP